MKHSILLILCVLIRFEIHGQSTLIFTGETVVTESCGGTILFDTIKIYNVTDEDVVLGWNRIQFDAPRGGTGFLIIDPYQYLFFQDAHFFSVHPGDSSQVIFHMFPDTLYPGDSMIWQLEIFDAGDSVQTNAVITAIGVCPLTSEVDEIDHLPNADLFPNPFTSTATLHHDEIPADQIRIFDLAGRLLTSRYVIGSATIVDRNGLDNGMYLLALYHEGRQTGQVRMMVTD